MLTSQWLDDWLSLRACLLKPLTLDQYRDLISRHINPAIGSIPLADLTPADVTHLLASISATGHTRTAELVYVLLRAALAEELPSLMLRVRRPAHVQQSPEAWTPDQIGVYLAALEGHKHQLALSLALMLGLRRGEICGLRWQDIDVNRRILHICNQRVRLADGRIIDQSPKSRSSIRDLPIPEPLWQLIRDRWQLSGYVCALTPSGLDRAHRVLTQSLDLPYIPLHGLRHTMATACVRAGGDLASLQRVLGHGSYSVTVDRYTHPDQAMMRAAVEISMSSWYNIPYRHYRYAP